MNRRPSSKSKKEQAKPRISGPGLTRPQKMVLFLVSLLVMAWIIVGVGLLLSTRTSLAQNKPNFQVQSNSQVSSPTLSSETIDPDIAIPSVPTIPITAACAQNYGVAQEGKVTQVEDDGVLQISTVDGILQAGFAGIELHPGGQPGEQALQAIRAMVENQPVALVRDLATQDGRSLVSGYIFTQQHFINYELVRQGLAVLDSNSADQSCAASFHLAEQQARSDQLGLWQPTPVPTRTFMPFVTLDPAKQPACDCSKRYECSDFTTHADAQVCYNACNDYNSRLDPDRDGIAWKSFLEEMQSYFWREP